MVSAVQDVTTLLGSLAQGEAGAADALAPLIYGELHRLAASYMRRERADHTLQATALVNETYVRLVARAGQSFENRAHFFGVAAHVMRQILVDYARAFRAQKRGGGEVVSADVEGMAARAEAHPPFVLELDAALEHLAQLSPRQSRVVEMRFFGGLSEEEIAAALGVSSRTVKRDWRLARAFLHGVLQQRESAGRHA